MTDKTLKILIMDDTRDTAEALQVAIEENIADCNVEIEVDFEKGLELLQRRTFDVLILDLYKGNPTDQVNAGDDLWVKISTAHFIPVIVYTSGDFRLSDFPTDNPLLKCFKKSAAGLKEIPEHLNVLQPFIDEIRLVKSEVDSVVRKVLYETSPHIWRAEPDAQLRRQRLLRSARRRVAASMDYGTMTIAGKLESWEQYVYPPLSTHLLCGDIIVKREGNREDPSSYRLVLSPSCDMQKNNGKCKIADVLVAKCVSVDKYLEASGFPAGTKTAKIEEKLPRCLNEPHQSGIVALPGFTTILPCLAADLRDLTLITIDSIAADPSDDKDYIRILSVDSPFREQIAWAYLQLAGRPGLPSRDNEKWAQDIVGSLEKIKEEQGVPVKEEPLSQAKQG